MSKNLSFRAKKKLVYLIILSFFLLNISCKKQNKKHQTTSPDLICIGSFAQTVPKYALDYIFENPHQIPLKIDSIWLEIPTEFVVADGKYEVLYLRADGPPNSEHWSVAEKADLVLTGQKGFLYFHTQNHFNNFETLTPDLYRLYLIIISSKMPLNILPFIEIQKKVEFSRPETEIFGFTANSEKKYYSWSDDLHKIKISYSKNISSEQIDIHKNYFLIQRLILNDNQVINLPVQKISGSELIKDSWETILALQEFFYVKFQLQSYLFQENPSDSKFNSTISISDTEFEIH